MSCGWGMVRRSRSLENGMGVFLPANWRMGDLRERKVAVSWQMAAQI